MNNELNDGFDGMETMFPSETPAPQSEEDAASRLSEIETAETHQEGEKPAEQEAVTDDPAESEAEQKTDQNEQPETPQPDAQTKPSKSQRRIEGLVGQVKDLQRQLSYYQDMTKQMGKEVNLDPLDYPNDAAYQRAVIEATATKMQSSFAETQAKNIAQQEQAVRQQVWDARTSEYKAQVPDFDEVAYSDQTPYSPHMLEMVKGMETGPQVAYFLGKNPEIAYRIAQLSPMETAMEMGRLSQFLSGPAQKTVSEAPKPVPTVTPKGAGKSGLSDGYSGQFEKWMEAGDFY